MYLYELAAQSSGIGSSVDGAIGTISSEKLRSGMNSILERIHNGETLDQVISSISGETPGGPYADTADFEKRFIKGMPDGDGKYGLEGDQGSMDFILPFLDYMDRIDKAKEVNERSEYAGGSVLFDFGKDYCSPLDFEETAPANVLQPLDDEDGNFQPDARSTVGDREAYSTGGKSESGTPDGTAAGGGTGGRMLAASPEKTSGIQEASDEAGDAAEDLSAAAAAGENSEAVVPSGEKPVSEEDSAVLSSAPGPSSESAPSEEAPAEGVPAEADPAPVTDTAPPAQDQG